MAAGEVHGAGAVVAKPAPRRPRIPLTQREGWKQMVRGIWAENPTFRMVLGICSALAVTNKLTNTLAMCIAVVFVTTSSSVTVSLLRRLIPRRVRMAVYTLIIATYVVVVDQYLKAFYPAISEAMGPYVGLIITNCIIMGRAESYASSNPPGRAFLDALGVGLGYAMSLIIVAFVRELLGFGTLFDQRVFGSWWEPWVIMVMAPGAFLVLGLYIWLLRGLQMRK